MTTSSGNRLLSGEEIATALIALGVDPDAERIGTLQAAIDADGLPAGDRQAAVRRVVEAAIGSSGAGADGQRKPPEDRVVVDFVTERKHGTVLSKVTSKATLDLATGTISDLDSPSDHRFDAESHVRWSIVVGGETLPVASPEGASFVVGRAHWAAYCERAARSMSGRKMPEVADYVIHSLSEKQEGVDGKVGAFWSNEDGWGSFETATRFTAAERMKRGSGMQLPVSNDYDAEWLSVQDVIALQTANTDPTVIEARVLSDYQRMLGKTVMVRSISGYRGNDSVDIRLSPPATVKIAHTEPASLKHWNDDRCDPYWEVVLVEPHPQLEDIRSTWISGNCYHLDGRQSNASDVISIVSDALEQEPEQKPSTPSFGI